MDILEKAYDALQHLMAYAVGATILVVLVVLRARMTRWLKRHFVAETVRNDSRVKEKLVEIRVRTKADRVSVFMFHNGEHYVNGKSILRISGAYESLNEGICSHRDSSQGILVSTVSEGMNFLIDDPSKKVHFRKVSDIEECYYQAVLISQGVKAVAKYPLKKNSEVIGFICADFVKNEGPSEKTLEFIKTTAPQIELHLNKKGPGRVKRLMTKLFGGGK